MQKLSPLHTTVMLLMLTVLGYLLPVRRPMCVWQIAILAISYCFESTDSNSIHRHRFKLRMSTCTKDNDWKTDLIATSLGQITALSSTEWRRQSLAGQTKLSDPQALTSFASCRPCWTDFRQDWVNMLLICTNGKLHRRARADARCMQPVMPLRRHCGRGHIAIRPTSRVT